MVTPNRLPMLKECCCGCTLRTGTMIIGFISLVAGVVASCITIVSLNKIQKEKRSNVMDIALDMVVITVRVVQIILSVLLIIGSHKGRASFVCPWLVLSLLMVIIESFYLFLMACELIVGSLNAQLFSLSSHISITIYFMLVVFSHYRELQFRSAVQVDEEKDKPVHYNANSTEVVHI